MRNAHPEAQAMFHRLFLEFELDAQKRRIEAAKRDPVGNKLTLQFHGKPASIRYYSAGKDGRGRTVRFGWTCHRNAAGYFLGFREVRNKDGSGKRDQWIAHKVRKRLIEIALRRRAAFLVKQDARKA